MAADLTSASTLTEINAAYDDNATYDLDADTDKAKSFIQACRFLLRRVADEIQAGGGERIQTKYEKIQAALDAALAWYRANSTTTTDSRFDGSVTHVTFNELRD